MSSVQEETQYSFKDILKKLIIEGYIALFLFWTLSIIVLMGFISRYIFNDSLTWTEEISRYILIIMVFIGSSMAIFKKAHIAIEFFYYRFNSKSKFYLSVFIDFLLVLFFLFCSVYSYELIVVTKEQNMVSVEISKSYVYWGVFLGFISITIRLVQRLYTHILHKKGF